MKISDLKKDIILKRNILYFDFAASALALKSVEKHILKILKNYANTHSDSSLNSFLMQEIYEKARQDIKKSLGLNDEFALIACGTGSSGAIKKFQELLGIYIPPVLKEKYFSNVEKSSLPLVLVGPYEHHSNELSFREGLCECIRIPLDTRGEIDFSILKKILKQNQKRSIIASFSLASNVTGILSDFKRICKLVRFYKGIVAFDASSFIPYRDIPCQFYDALFISSHKILGGVGGCGILVIKKKLCGIKPSFAAGGTVSYVSRTNQHYLCNEEALEEGGTPGILQLVRASLAFQVKESIPKLQRYKKEKILKEYFFKKLELVPNIKIYAANLKKRVPIFSFNVEGISPFDLAFELSQKFHIETRAGCACAGPYGHDLLNLKDNEKLHFKPGWMRVSLHYTHDKEDIEYFFYALNKSIQKLRR
ncbi:aminotransferase class V-fold PLP-dependent enzyme [Campylobacter sp. MIT 21-1685]|uniref:aminotransferase class V-fold PLP-dependent enzyme n=1 Tax=unclassified Campylobacter TaxID=2593542 RepID=UPI00224B1BE3|nr:MULTISPECIES: aminotransferase class V-fold PLP-dependent enzyme [unclassified Campylobacter]MCX2682264.1 aminotransferase class V-fold PLP-dependent enzyme [Campylobacter sp. MIT 21-1684]MCX2750545.1 aminotransferase class V-fold PLP-dependent enzyme [Campylobacter sp. MIT 21-1682]MCX2806907.1 aminotransferase class V-fold PLP-dependent enzyme [Campylobacter sp. MIT 21-1685]